MNYLKNKNIEQTDDEIIRIMSSIIEEIPEENLNSKISLIKSLSSSLGELLKNSHVFSFSEWNIFGVSIKNSIYKDLKGITKNLVKLRNGDLTTEKIVENPLQRGDKS